MAERRTRRRPAKQPATSQVVTTGTALRIETPKSQRKPKSKATTVIVQEINPVGGFIGFLRDHAIIGLSIGFIIGNQMATFVKVLVQSFIDPLTKLFFGTALSQRTFLLHFHGRQAVFAWGAVIYNLIIILFLLILIYAAIRIFNLEHFDKPAKKDN